MGWYNTLVHAGASGTTRSAVLMQWYRTGFVSQVYLGAGTNIVATVLWVKREPAQSFLTTTRLCEEITAEPTGHRWLVHDQHTIAPPVIAQNRLPLRPSSDEGDVKL